MTRFVPLFILVMLAVVLGYGLGKDPAVIPSPLIGKQAPDFKLPTLADSRQLIANEDLLGAPYLLNVWGTWCANCRYEHPLLMQIANEGQIAVIGLNYKDEKEAALRWLEDYGDPYQAVAVDTDGSTGIDFGVYGAPETFLIDANGIVQHKIIGILTPEIWTDTLAPMVNSLSAN